MPEYRKVFNKKISVTSERAQAVKLTLNNWSYDKYGCWYNVLWNNQTIKIEGLLFDALALNDKKGEFIYSENAGSRTSDKCSYTALAHNDHSAFSVLAN